MSKNQIVAKRTEGGFKQSSSVLLMITNSYLQENAECRAFQDRFFLFALSAEYNEDAAIEESIAKISHNLKDAGVRWLTVLGHGKGAILASALAAKYPKLVRRLLLIEPSLRFSSRCNYNIWNQALKCCSKMLCTRNFQRGTSDIRFLLHRIQCPTLIVNSKLGTGFSIWEGQYIQSRIPNSWIRQVSEVKNNGDFSAEVTSLLDEFMDVPVKCSQKAKGVSKSVT